MMCGQKKTSSLAPNYLISVYNETDKTEHVIGKVKSNVLGTMFDIWDSGKKITKTNNEKEVRISKGCVTYVRNFY